MTKEGWLVERKKKKKETELDRESSSVGPETPSDLRVIPV